MLLEFCYIETVMESVEKMNKIEEYNACISVNII